MTHEAAQRDSLSLALPGIDSHRLDVRLLAPIDLAVSKLARFSDQDRSDILSLALHQDVHAAPLRLRAQEALAGYVGSVDRIRGSIEVACRILEGYRRLV